MLETAKKDCSMLQDKHLGTLKRQRRNTRSGERMSESMQIWKDKVLHGQFMKQTEEEGGKERWLWLSGTGIKRETELLIMAAQEQAIRTNVIKARIDRTQKESKCRMCGRADETINHLLSECSKMAQKEYKRHDWMGEKNTLGRVQEK